VPGTPWAKRNANTQRLEQGTPSESVFNLDTRNYWELGKGSIHCGQRVATITVDHPCRLHLTVGKESGVGEGITNRLSSQAAKRGLS
jgi:hypothetical protein